MERRLGSGAVDTIEPTARAELRPGERLLWWGRPRFSVLFRQGSAASLIGIPFTLFAVLWTVGVFHSNWREPPDPLAPWFALLGLFPIAIGLLFLTYPLRLALAAGATVYGVTDQRAFIIQGRHEHKIESFGPSDIGHLERRQRADGSGNLIFRREPTGRRSRAFGVEQLTHYGFFGIADVRRVEDLVREVAGKRNTER